MNRKFLIASITAIAIVSSSVFAVNGGNTTIKEDTILDRNYDTLKISGTGTPENWIEVDGNFYIVQCLIIDGQYIRVKNINVTGCSGHGVLITGKNIFFENSRVYNNVTENGTAPNCNGTGGWGSGVKVQVGGENITIQNNYVYNNCGEGIGVTRGINVNVLNNYVKDNFSVNIYLDNSPNAKAINNIVWCTGIVLRNGSRPNGIASAEESYSGWGTQRHDVIIQGNYVQDCNDGISSWKSEIATGAEIRLLVQDNKILNSVRSIKLDSPVNQGVVVSNNLIEKPITVRNNTGVTLTNNMIAPVVRIEVPILDSILPTITPQISTLTPTKTQTPMLILSETSFVTLTTTQSLTSTVTVTRSPTSTSTITKTALPTVTRTPIPTITSTPTSFPTVTSTFQLWTCEITSNQILCKKYP